jgi:DNA replicative helicase MCM subunit Mcm2 (Cdc46/Mcm family)
VTFKEGKYEPPTACGGAAGSAGCRSRLFSPLHESAVTVDWQKVRVQELEADLADAGRVPRTLEVELAEDLVDSVVPGDVVTVGGVVKTMEVEVAAGKGGGAASKSLFVLYMDARSVSTHKAADKAAAAGAGAGSRAGEGALGAPSAGQRSVQYSERDLAFLARMRGHRDVLSLVVASACPSIFGQEVVKAGMLLALFGGTPKHLATAAAAAAAAVAMPAGGGSVVSSLLGSPGGSSTYGGSQASTLHPSHSVSHTSLLARRADDRDAGSSCGVEGTPAYEEAAAAGGGEGGRVSGRPDAASLEKAGKLVPVRCDPHVLVVGDPGMGKSQMLQAIAALAPRGVYVCGGTTSSTGLTVVRAAREEGSSRQRRACRAAGHQRGGGRTS